MGLIICKTTTFSGFPKSSSGLLILEPRAGVTDMKLNGQLTRAKISRKRGQFCSILGRSLTIDVSRVSFFSLFSTGNSNILVMLIKMLRRAKLQYSRNNV